jgi:hypothetical protein
MVRVEIHPYLQGISRGLRFGTADPRERRGRGGALVT